MIKGNRKIVSIAKPQRTESEKNRRLATLIGGISVLLLFVWYLSTNTSQERFNAVKHGHFARVNLRLDYANNQTRVAKTIIVDPRGDRQGIDALLGIQPDNTVARNPDARVVPLDGGLISVTSAGIMSSPAVTKDGVTSVALEVNRATVLPILKMEILMSVVTDRGLSIRPTITAVVRPHRDSKPTEFVPVSSREVQMIFVPDKLAQSYKLLVDRVIFPGQQLIVTASWPSTGQ
jgi:hypothetical protein